MMGSAEDVYRNAGTTDFHAPRTPLAHAGGFLLDGMMRKGVERVPASHSQPARASGSGRPRQRPQPSGLGPQI
jgi:hypothetical protein